MDNNREIEVRFLEINKTALIQKLEQVGAVDNGVEQVKEIIFYDKDMKWPAEWKFVRLRQDKNGFWLTFKKVEEFTPTGTIEIETKVDNWDKAKEFMEAIGLVAFREQEKKRHQFILDKVAVDIIDWPQVPSLVELEGASEEVLRAVADKLGFDWSTVEFHDNRWVMENKYGIPFTNYKYFTFNKIE